MNQSGVSCDNEIGIFGDAAQTISERKRVLVNVQVFYWEGVQTGAFHLFGGGRKGLGVANWVEGQRRRCRLLLTVGGGFGVSWSWRHR